MEKRKFSLLLVILLIPFFLGNVNLKCSAIRNNCIVNVRYYAALSRGNGTIHSLENGVIGFTDLENSGCTTIEIYRTSGSRNIYYLTYVENVTLGVGAGGVIVRYFQNWEEVNSPTTKDLYKLFFVSTTLIAVGAEGTIIKSTDSGLNWELVNPPSSSLKLTDVYIDSYLSSFVQVVGEDLSIFQTFNGGVTWQKIDLIKPGGSISKVNEVLPAINRLYHFDGLNAYIVGDSGTFIKTTDNFSTSEKIEYIDLQTSENLNDIYFISPDSGVVIGDNGTVRFTTDGGNDWLEDPDLTAQLKGFNLKRISVYNNEFGTIIADSGLSITVAKDSSYFTAVNEEPKKISSYSLSQNYPNPFNPSTKIKYEIPAPPNLPKGEVLVQLKVYDILGREVKTLVNEQKQSGAYEVEFDASRLSSGIYFYKLSASNFTETKKLVLLK